MLAIRLQRLGRKALPVYRVAVQESHRHPSSGRVVAYIGSYNPHTKAVKFDTEKVTFYLKNGAQPTPRVVRLLQEQKIPLPAWVKIAAPKQAGTKHAEKLRKNQPAPEPTAAAPEGAEADSQASVEAAQTNET